MMRALKIMSAFVGLLVLAQYLAIYYNAQQFDDVVQKEMWSARPKGQLKPALLNRARDYSLPVKESDIIVSTSGEILRVAVDYKVPLNLIVYSPQLKFHAAGSGFSGQ